MKSGDGSNKISGPFKCFLILMAAPTFYMPLVYLGVACWALINSVAENAIPQPTWFSTIGYLAVNDCFILWPIYGIWAVASKHLTKEERFKAYLVIILLNAIGMPLFYIFMTRRYFGFEKRSFARSQAFLEQFLRKCNLDQNRLAAPQLNIFAQYNWGHNVRRKGAIAATFLLILVAYASSWGIPRKFADVLAVQAPPERFVIYRPPANAENDTELFAEKEQYRILVVCLTASNTLIAASSAMLWGYALCSYFGGHHRKAFIEYLKTTQKEATEAAKPQA